MDQQQLVQLLRELVAIDSVNPSLVPGAKGEDEAARYLQQWLRQRGVEAVLQEASDDARLSRPNVVARIGGRAAQTPALVLLAHVDTVGAGDMPDPFIPREEDGRLIGRGALDIKSGVAAICSATASLVHDNVTLRKPLLVAVVVDEECNSLGAQKLSSEYSADAAVVLEPTDLKLCVAHKGYAWLEVVTHGRAAHGSQPEEGRDAIAHMGRVLQRIEQLDAALAQRPPHPLLGRASVHASLISGGHELSSYPAECRLHIERRTLPGEADAAMALELQDILADLAREDPAFRAQGRLTAARAPYQIAEDAPIVRASAGAIRKIQGSCAVAGASFWTDTALLHAAGIPGVVFGPCGRGLHAAQEYVELDSVLACAHILRELAVDLCAA
jgi:acetylornithine deacetylase